VIAKILTASETPFRTLTNWSCGIWIDLARDRNNTRWNWVHAYSDLNLGGQRMSEGVKCEHCIPEIDRWSTQKLAVYREISLWSADYKIRKLLHAEIDDGSIPQKWATVARIGVAVRRIVQLSVPPSAWLAIKKRDTRGLQREVFFKVDHSGCPRYQPVILLLSCNVRSTFWPG
jgi:hypothetical protein